MPTKSISRSFWPNILIGKGSKNPLTKKFCEIEANIKMKPGRKGVQVSLDQLNMSLLITKAEDVNEKLTFVRQVLSSLAASLCQMAVGHCVPLSAYVIPQVFKVLFHISHIWPGFVDIEIKAVLVSFKLLFVSVGGEFRRLAFNDFRGELLVWWVQQKNCFCLAKILFDFC